MAKKKAGGAAAAESVLELPVSFGNLNVGDVTCRIGIHVDRKALSIAQADRSLCGKRLAGRLVAEPGNDNPDQEALFDAATELHGVFDVKSFGVSRKAISTGLTFSIESVDIASLAYFAKRAGRLVIDAIEELPEGDGGDGDE